MTEELAQMKSALREHSANKEHGAAYIQQLDRADGVVTITFELPRGSDSFTKQWPDTEDMWEDLYAETGTTPPCIDTLIDTSVPVEWSDEQGEWTLPTLGEYDVSSRNEDDASKDLSPAKWSLGVFFSFVITTILSVIVGIYLGILIASGQIGEIRLVVGVLLFLWMCMGGHAYQRMRSVVRKEYDWVGDW